MKRESDKSSESSNIDNQLKRAGASLPLVSAFGVSIGVVYDLSYYWQIKLSFFFLAGLADHVLHAVAWMVGSFAMLAFSVATRVIDEVDLIGAKKRPAYIGFIWIGNPWVRTLSFLATAIGVFAAPPDYKNLVALFAVLCGLSHYSYILHRRSEAGQSSGLLDAYVPIAFILLAAYLAGIYQFSRDKNSRDRVTIYLENGEIKDAVLMRATSSGLLLHIPPRDEFEFVNTGEFRRIRLQNNQQREKLDETDEVTQEEHEKIDLRSRYRSVWP